MTAWILIAIMGQQVNELAIFPQEDVCAVVASALNSHPEMPGVLFVCDERTKV